VNFTDNPALLVKISNDGLVELNSYQGVIKGPLEGVSWKNDPKLLEEAKKIILDAQIDKVAFRVNKNGEFQIWYQSVEGAISLNKKLQSVFNNHKGTNHPSPDKIPYFNLPDK
jgi:hypothetical protein